MWTKVKRFLAAAHTRATLAAALDEAWQLLDELASAPMRAEFDAHLHRAQFVPAMYLAERTAVSVAVRKDVPREFWTAMSRLAGRMRLPREAERYRRIAASGQYVAR